MSSTCIGFTFYHVLLTEQTENLFKVTNRSCIYVITQDISSFFTYLIGFAENPFSNIFEQANLLLFLEPHPA